MMRLWHWSVWLLVTGAALGVSLGLLGGWSTILDAIGYFRIQLARRSDFSGSIAWRSLAFSRKAFFWRS